MCMLYKVFVLFTITARTVLCEALQCSPREEAPSNGIGGAIN